MCKTRKQKRPFLPPAPAPAATPHKRGGNIVGVGDFSLAEKPVGSFFRRALRVPDTALPFGKKTCAYCLHCVACAKEQSPPPLPLQTLPPQVQLCSQRPSPGISKRAVEPLPFLAVTRHNSLMRVLIMSGYVPPVTDHGIPFGNRKWPLLCSIAGLSSSFYPREQGRGSKLMPVLRCLHRGFPSTAPATAPAPASGQLHPPPPPPQTNRPRTAFL